MAIQQETDMAPIVDTVLDYFEGWFTGDVERMTRALHPELAKRSLADDGESLDVDTSAGMISATARGAGKSRGSGDRRIEVEVEDVYGSIASVTVRSTVYREYLHLARTRDGWKIVNALWLPT